MPNIIFTLQPGISNRLNFLLSISFAIFLKKPHMMSFLLKAARSEIRILVNNEIIKISISIQEF